MTIPKAESELRAIHSQLAAFPYSYQITTQSNVRRAFLRSCRHTIYFGVLADVVTVYAVLPQRAGPGLFAQLGIVG